MGRGRDTPGETTLEQNLAQMRNGDKFVALHSAIDAFDAKRVAASLAVATRVEWVDLRGRGAAYDETAALVLWRGVLATRSPIRVLRLRGALLTPAILANACAFVSASETLEELDAGCNSSTAAACTNAKPITLTVASASALAGALLQSRSVKRVNVAWSGIDESACGAWAALLAVSPCLVSVDLSHNAVGTSGAVRLARGLVHSRSLQSLVVVGNGIGTEGLCALATAFVSCASLRVLDVRDNVSMPLPVVVVGAVAASLRASARTCVRSLRDVVVLEPGPGRAIPRALSAARVFQQEHAAMLSFRGAAVVAPPDAVAASKSHSKGLGPHAQAKKNKKSPASTRRFLLADGDDSLSRLVWSFLDSSSVA